MHELDHVKVRRQAAPPGSDRLSAMRSRNVDTLQQDHLRAIDGRGASAGTPVPDQTAFMDDLTSRFLVSAVGSLVGALSGGIIAAIIAASSYRRDRKASAVDRYDERTTIAAENLLLALTPLVTVNPFAESWAVMLRDFRARVILYQTVLKADEAFLADWLMLERYEGMHLFLEASLRVDNYPVAQGYVDDWMLEQFEPAQTWANNTMLLLAGWRRGSVAATTIHDRGADILMRHPAAASQINPSEPT